MSCVGILKTSVTDNVISNRYSSASQNVGQLFDIIRYDRTGGPVEEQEGNSVLKLEHVFVP